MRAQIKGFDCSRVPDLETWKPLSPADVYFGLAIHIGTPDQEGADLFQMGVATREGLQRVLGENYRDPEPHMLTIHKRDWQLIEEGSVVLWELVEAHVQSIVDRCEGDNWEEVAIQLSAHFAWEFGNHNFESALHL